MSARLQRWRRFLPIVALFLLALGLRGAALQHGSPRNYIPDTHAVRAALGMARDVDFTPEVGKYSSYPYLMPYLLLPVYGAQYALGRARGEWAGGEEYGGVLADHPERASLPARGLVAVFGAATVAAMFAAARAAGLGRGAWVSAFLVATGLLHVQMSLHERPWVIVVFFGTLCLWAALSYAREPRRRTLVLSGAAAGLAFATHQAGAFFVFLTALAWLFAARDRESWRGPALRDRIVDATLSAVACLVVALALGHSYYLRHGDVDVSGIAGGARSAEHFTIGGQALAFGLSWKSFLHLGRALVGYDPVLVCLGVLGMWAARREVHLRAAFAFTLGYAVFFLFNPNDHVRYLVPLTVLLALPAGWVGERVLQRRVGAIALVTLCALPTLQAGRLVWLMRREDTRAAAERRLDELVADPTARVYVAIDHYGPEVDLSRRALEELAGAEFRELRTRELRRLEQLRAGLLPGGRAGIDALKIDDWMGFDDAKGVYALSSHAAELADSPVELFHTLGVTHFLMVNRRPARADAPHLSGAAQDWIPVWIEDPSRPGGGEAPEAFLPTEMDFPLSALWRVDRPGPWLCLYALPAR